MYSRLVIACALLGCGKTSNEAEKPRQHHYQLRLTTRMYGPGVELAFPEGRVIAVDKVNENGGNFTAFFDAPSSAKPLTESIELRAMTPCGPKTFPIKTQVPGGRGSTLVEKELDMRKGTAPIDLIVYVPESIETPTTELYVDIVGGKAKLGSVALAQGRQKVLDLGCKPDLALELTGVATQTVDLTSKDARAYLITDRANICYRLSVVAYGNATAPPPEIFTGKNVYAIDPVGYFLTPAPASVAGTKDSPEAIRTELVVAGCP